MHGNMHWFRMYGRDWCSGVYVLHRFGTSLSFVIWMKGACLGDLPTCVWGFCMFQLWQASPLEPGWRQKLVNHEFPAALAGGKSGYTNNGAVDDWRHGGVMFREKKYGQASMREGSRRKKELKV